PGCEAVIVQDPAPVMWTVVPETPQLPDAAKLTLRPEVAEAFTTKSESPKLLSGRAPKVIVCAAFCAVTVSVTCGAAPWLTSPAWSYLTVQVLVPAVMVKVAPLFVHEPELLYETGNPDEDTALTVNCVLWTAAAGACVVTV